MPPTVSDLALPDRLIEVGEQLYGTHGLDGVSLRQISAAAGTRNNFAVQYHFGDAAGLIRAILAKRVPDFEARRADLLARLPVMEDVSTRQLVEVLFRPFYDIGPVATRFFLTIRTSHWGWSEMGEVDAEMSVTDRALRLIEERNPQVPAAIIRHRAMNLTYMVMATACAPRNPTESDDPEAELADIFAMAAAALSAPVGQG